MNEGGDKKVLANRTNALGPSTATTLEKPQSIEHVNSSCRYFKVLYTKYAPHKKRKNKSFEDGFVVVGGQPGQPSRPQRGKYLNKVTLLDQDSKEKVSVGFSKIGKMLSGVLKQFDDGDDVDSFTLGGYDVELDGEVSSDDFLTGAMFLEGYQQVSDVGKIQISSSTRPYKAFARPLAPGPKTAAVQRSSLVTPKSKVTPMFNPNRPESLVLNKSEWEADKEAICPVVLDPALYKCMRPHQKEGVQFLYRCMTEAVGTHRGCILADDMGLGKSLQAIGLLHTMLKQGPRGLPMLQRALIVAPSSLLENWKQEIKKWLGDEKLKSIIIGVGAKKEQSKQTVVDFKFGKVFKVGIISYETLRKYSSDLSGFVDIIVADEGHRLKSVAGNKTIDALQGLSAGRKILLSGTPLQV